METTIYIATHKKFNVPNLEGYVPIEVGADLRDERLGYLLDNTGDNISSKNKTFCELTATYWIWKNSKAKNVGLCHYRRYFSSSRVSPDQKLFISSKEVDSILNKYDIIMPEKWNWKHHTVASAYDSGSGYIKDLKTLREIIKELYPEYVSSYDDVLSSNSTSYCNMLITSKDLFNQFCEWMFTILFEAEKRINIENYTVEEQRIFGYMSELLTNVWVQKQGLKVYYQPIITTTLKGKKVKILRLLEKIKPFKSLTKCMNCKD